MASRVTTLLSVKRIRYQQRGLPKTGPTSEEGERACENSLFTRRTVRETSKFHFRRVGHFPNYTLTPTLATFGRDKLA